MKQGDFAWDSLNADTQQFLIGQHRRILDLMNRYGITEAEATKLQLGILSGELPPPERAE